MSHYLTMVWYFGKARLIEWLVLCISPLRVAAAASDLWKVATDKSFVNMEDNIGQKQVS